jgi:glucose/arabinose dehydrogenase
MKILIFLFFYVSALWAQQSSYISEGQKFIFETVLKRSDVIWGLDFLPDGKLIFNERAGKMFLFDDKTKKTTELKGVPKVKAAGQGGLLDVKVHPEFSKNGLVYFTYSEPLGETSTTALGRARLIDGALVEFKRLFSGQRPNVNDIHYGSRIVFDGKGHVFFTMGDRDERTFAQDLMRHQGKVMRLNEDGSVPGDNPFVSQKSALPEIWSFGHRNPQGLALHPSSGELYEVEFGPQGGDELNLVRVGKNYGWPVITYGREYHGPKIGEGTSKEGMVGPLAHWVPSISPSGMTFYTGAAFPAWEGNIFLANLGSQHLRRLVLSEGKIIKQEALLRDQGLRFRHVRVGPQGYLYLTSDEGLIGRIRPVSISR